MKNLGVAIAWFLVGCGPAGFEGDGEVSSSNDEPIERLERDFGGPDGVVALFESTSPDDLRVLLADYGMGYADPLYPRLITDCPKYFPSSDRNIWHSVSGEHYYIDGSGRPSRAYADLPPIASEARNTTCQTYVGQWGDAENLVTFLTNNGC